MVHGPGVHVLYTSAPPLIGFLYSLRRTTVLKEPAASVYNVSDLLGLEICKRTLEEHTRILIAIWLSQSTGDLFEALGDSLAVFIVRKMSDISNASCFVPKENT